MKDLPTCLDLPCMRERETLLTIWWNNSLLLIFSANLVFCFEVRWHFIAAGGWAGDWEEERWTEGFQILLLPENGGFFKYWYCGKNEVLLTYHSWQIFWETLNEYFKQGNKSNNKLCMFDGILDLKIFLEIHYWTDHHLRMVPICCICLGH